ncbi:unnamed protein product [Ascophyllum nodosum]
MKIDFDSAAALDVETPPPIKLSYHGRNHYNSVLDKSIIYPLKPRRSKNILRMREAQHARTSRSSSSSTGQKRGIRRLWGGCFGMRNFAGMVYRTISRGGVSNRKGCGVE